MCGFWKFKRARVYSTFLQPCALSTTGRLEVIGKINVWSNKVEAQVAQPVDSILQYQNDKQIAITRVANSILYSIMYRLANRTRKFSCLT